MKTLSSILLVAGLLSFTSCSHLGMGKKSCNKAQCSKTKKCDDKKQCKRGDSKKSCCNKDKKTKA